MSQSQSPHPLITSLRPDIDEVVSLWPQIVDAWNEIRDSEGTQIDHKITLQWGGTLEQFQVQFLSFLAMLETISKATNLMLIPTEPSQNIQEKLNRLRRLLEEQLQMLKQSKEVGVAQVTAHSVAFSRADGAKFDLNTGFNELFQLISALSLYFFPIVHAVNLDIRLEGTVEKLQGNVQELSKLSVESRSIVAEIRGRRADAESASLAAIDLKSQTEADRAEAQRNKNESSVDRNTTADYKSEASTRLAEIRQVAENAANLSSQVTAYDTQFTLFKGQLEERDKSYATQSGRVDDLIKKNELSAAEIERLTKDANAMLTGAVVAGLASAYAAIKKELNDQLGWARWGFFVGIVFLTLSLLPLAAYTVPFLGNWLGQAPPPSDLKVESYALQILARLALLLPAAWYLRFAANRHAALFRLREEYAHRYSLASSVEGFKKQAEEFKDQIAAATYENISINPASAMDKSKNSNDGDPPTPIMRAFVDAVEKTFWSKDKK